MKLYTVGAFSNINGRFAGKLSRHERTRHKKITALVCHLIEANKYCHCTIQVIMT